MARKYRMVFFVDGDDEPHVFETHSPNDEAAREEFEDAFPDSVYVMHDAEDILAADLPVGFRGL